jgi:hypothetical protein
MRRSVHVQTATIYLGAKAQAAAGLVWVGAREVRCIELDIVMASIIVMGHAILWRGTRAWWILVAVTKRSAQLP